MPNPEIPDPSSPEGPPDATLRLPLGVPADPRSTVQMHIPQQPDALSAPQSPISEPSANASQTQKMPISELLANPDQTQKVSIPEVLTHSNQTQKLLLPLGDEPPLRRQKVDLPAEAEGQTQQAALQPDAAKPLWGKLLLGLGALVVLGVGVALLIARRPSPLVPGATASVSMDPGAAESIPPAARSYFERAQAGDTYAMRMLGAMYYYGLNVPQDRAKGLYWYRKAAEQGSDAARTELNKIEGSR